MQLAVPTPEMQMEMNRPVEIWNRSEHPFHFRYDQKWYCVPGKNGCPGYLPKTAIPRHNAASGNGVGSKYGVPAYIAKMIFGDPKLRDPKNPRQWEVELTRVMTQRGEHTAWFDENIATGLLSCPQLGTHQPHFYEKVWEDQIAPTGVAHAPLTTSDMQWLQMGDPGPCQPLTKEEVLEQVPQYRISNPDEPLSSKEAEKLGMAQASGDGSQLAGQVNNLISKMEATPAGGSNFSFA